MAFTEMRLLESVFCYTPKFLVIASREEFS